jgi:hypothetical protein
MTYRTKKIPVPMRWTAKSEPQGARLERLPITILPSKPSQAMISLRVLSPARGRSHKESSESFEAVYWTYLAGNRVVTGPVQVLSGPDEGVCMESSAKGSDGLYIACLVFQDRWTVSLLGTKKERSEFYEILRGIR